MEDRRKTIAAVTIIVGFLALVGIILVVLLTRGKTLSPVPDEGAIKIIFVSPTPVSVASASATPTSQNSPTPTRRAATVTPKPTPTKVASPSATPTS